MWLTLLRFSRRNVPGHQWIGKHRKTKKVTYSQRLRLKKEAKMIADVDNILCRPYLTVAEEECQNLAKERRENQKQKWYITKQLRWHNKKETVFNEIDM